MFLSLEGIAGSGKSTVRDRLLADSRRDGQPLLHVGQFSWLSATATRHIVALRTGSTVIDKASTVAAVCRDLDLHAHHNLDTANRAGNLIADRLVLSTACLLALRFGGPMREYLLPLADTTARPTVTLLLTTPVDVCLRRLTQRQSPRRFGESPAQAAELFTLYRHAAAAWAELTETEVLHQNCTDADDLEAAVDACAQRLLTAGQSTLWEA